MKKDPIQRQKEELKEFQKKYREVDPSDYRKKIYQKEIENRKNKIDCHLMRKSNSQDKLLDFYNFSRIYGYR